MSSLVRESWRKLSGREPQPRLIWDGGYRDGRFDAKEGKSPRDLSTPKGNLTPELMEHYVEGYKAGYKDHGGGKIASVSRGDVIEDLAREVRRWNRRNGRDSYAEADEALVGELADEYLHDADWRVVDRLNWNRLVSDVNKLNQERA